MKKNLISVVILALLLVNLILTTIMMISILPQTNRVNDLIAKVAAAIDIDMAGGAASSDGADSGANYNLADLEPHDVNAGETSTVNLKPSEGDPVEHYAVIKLSLNVDTKHEDYGTLGSAEDLTSRDNMIMGCAQEVISSHTIEEMRENIGAVEDEVLARIRKEYNSDVIATVSITATYQ